MTRLSIAIAGIAGRMGRELARAALDQGIGISGGTERDGAGVFEDDIGLLAGRQPVGVRPVANVKAAAAGAQVWIDFTRPAATLAAIEALAGTQVSAIVIGTTGFAPEEEAQIHAAAQTYAIVKSGNFSLGINLLQAMTRLVAARLGPDWDIEILETHHRHKADAPSGTALMLGEAAAGGRGQSLESLRTGPYDGPEALREAGQIGFSVRRMGGVIGAHEVAFGTSSEIISLSHTALGRDVFAQGALRAALWAADQAPGLYGMEDVLGLGNTP